MTSSDVRIAFIVTQTLLNNPMAEQNAILVDIGAKNEEVLDRNRVTFDLTPDLCRKGSQICREFLGGLWSQLKDSQIEISRIDGGVSNVLIRCSISAKVVRELRPVAEPTEVVIKFYGQKETALFDNNQVVLNDQIVSWHMSQKGLGPRLLLLFPEGQILEFVKVNSRFEWI